MRRFFLRTANPRPIETPIRLIATLSDGKHCFRANAIVEKVHAAGEGPVRDSGMTLWLARMDDPGRELVAWMGGQPPPLLKQPAAPEAAVLAPPAPPPPPPKTPAQASDTLPPQAVDESDELPSARPTKPSGAIIGIDLGTTNSCAAVVKDVKPFVIPSREGYNTIPSVVALSDKGKLMVGHPARSQLLINPRNTVYGAKRLIGRQFKSPVVTDLLERFSYEVVSGPRGGAGVVMGGRVFPLHNIHSRVLSEVKDLAERWLGTEISRAVIT